MPFPVEARYVDAAEQKLDVRFPSIFRGKMLRENGGDVEADGEDWILHPFFDSGDRKHLARTCNDIVRETEKERQTPGFPPAAVVIAHNGGGDLLVFLPKETNAGELAHEVFRWDHETGELAKVADDFAELLGI